MPKSIHIVGHGLAGCVLAMTLYRRGIPFTISGESRTGEASMASSGLIAPVTGRRYVKAWRIDEFIPCALSFYRWTEQLFGQTFFFPVEIVRFLSNPEAHKAWNKRLQDPEYSFYISSITYPELDALNKPYGILTGGYRLDTPGWVQAARDWLTKANLFEACSIRPDTYMADDRRTIWATGSLEPSLMRGIIPNKGESLRVRMPQWKIRQVVKDEVFIVPLSNEYEYWVGSFYEPGEADPGPSPGGQDRLLQAIKKIYGGPIEIVEHWAGIRPTVDDRRPLIGQRPGHDNQYVFNGMGTKGTSLAPYWADQLIRQVTENVPLPAEVLPDRYA